MCPALELARRSLRVVPMLLALGAVSLALASCGGGSEGSASAAGESDETAEQEAARLKLEQCLEDQGVEAPRRTESRSGSGDPDGGGGPEVVRPSEGEIEELQEALEGPCKKYRDKAFGEISEEDRQEFEDARLKFEACLEREGVDIESESSGGMQTFRVEGDDAETREAMEKCRKLLPDRGEGGPGLRLGPPPGGGGGGGD
jgi:hypothetical protein